MADVNLPSFGELGQMEFMSPLAYQQAQNQIGLANQFQQQNLGLGAQDLQAKTLANQFSEQANPMRLQGMGLENEAKTNANAMSGVDARTAMALEPEAKAAKRQALLAKASEDDLKQLMSTAEKEYMSDDPVVSKRGENKLLHTKAELTRRNAASDALEKAQSVAQARLEGIQMAQEGQNSRTAATNASKESIAAQKERALQNKANGNPKTSEAAAVKFQMESDMEDDPTEKARLAQLAKQYGAYSMALKNAQAGTKPDMAQFGFSTNPVNMGVGSTNPASTKQAPASTGDPLMDAIRQTESRGNPNAVSPKGAVGTMQTMPNTLTDPGFGVRPAANNSPEELQRVGVDYARALKQKYNDPTLMAIAYNWGPGNTDEWIKSGADYNKLPAETKSYVSQVMTRAAVNSRTNPQSAGQPSQAPAGPATPKAPAGRVVIYKEGKAVGSVPEAQVEAAKQQGYTIQ